MSSSCMNVVFLGTDPWYHFSAVFISLYHRQPAVIFIHKKAVPSHMGRYRRKTYYQKMPCHIRNTTIARSRITNPSMPATVPIAELRSFLFLSKSVYAVFAA